MKPSKAVLSPNNPLCKVGFARTRCLTLPDADNKKWWTLVHHFLRASLFLGSVFRFHFESAYTIIGIPFANKNFHFPQHLRMIHLDGNKLFTRINQQINSAIFKDTETTGNRIPNAEQNKAYFRLMIQFSALKAPRSTYLYVV